MEVSAVVTVRDPTGTQVVSSAESEQPNSCTLKVLTVRPLHVPMFTVTVSPSDSVALLRAIEGAVTLLSATPESPGLSKSMRTPP